MIAMTMIQLKLWKYGGDDVVKMWFGDDVVVVVAVVIVMVNM